MVRSAVIANVTPVDAELNFFAHGIPPWSRTEIDSLIIAAISMQPTEPVTTQNFRRIGPKSSRHAVRPALGAGFAAALNAPGLRHQLASDSAN